MARQKNFTVHCPRQQRLSVVVDGYEYVHTIGLSGSSRLTRPEIRVTSKGLALIFNISSKPGRPPEWKSEDQPKFHGIGVRTVEVTVSEIEDGERSMTSFVVVPKSWDFHDPRWSSHGDVIRARFPCVDNQQVAAKQVADEPVEGYKNGQ